MITHILKGHNTQMKTDILLCNLKYCAKVAIQYKLFNINFLDQFSVSYCTNWIVSWAAGVGEAKMIIKQGIKIMLRQNYSCE